VRLRPARLATSTGSTPDLIQSETPAWRREYGTSTSGVAASSSVSAWSRAVSPTSQYSVDLIRPPRVDQPEEWLESPHLIRAWVAEADGHIVGHIGVGRPHSDQAALLWVQQSGCPESHVAVAERLFVAPERRGTGVGKKPLAEVAQYADEKVSTSYLR
jgi:GNAT superfamily N-acetyltransferase